MRHGIDLKPIHNVKDAGQIPAGRPKPDLVFHLWSVLLRPPFFAKATKGIVRSSLRERSRMVERIGIEPMTSSLQS